MKKISIVETELPEVLAQIDALDGISPKDKNCLRLLSEEMVSMVTGLLNKKVMDFSIKMDGKHYSLCVSTETQVNEDAKEQFLSISSSGKNAANKGVKGLLGSVLEFFSTNSDLAIYSNFIPYGLCTPANDTANIWLLSQYLARAPIDKITEDWDGMEKSIIANFSDDVEISVRSEKLAMTVTKTF